MDRGLFYTQEQLRSWDLLSSLKDALYASSSLTEDLLGTTYTVVAGLVPTATGTLTISLGAGRIYELAQADATAVAGGILPADTNEIVQQGYVGSQTKVLTTTGLTVGQSQWVLIEAGFTQADNIRAGDPNSGLLNFFNSANPMVPLQGIGGNDEALPTVRQALCTVNLVYGNPASSGSEVPPSASSGFVGLYLIDLAYGQTVVNQDQVLNCGPSVGTGVPNNYPVAPILAGLLNSHHGGTPGQAPKINLGTETTGTLPAAAMLGAQLYFGGADSGTQNAIVTSFAVPLAQMVNGNTLLLATPGFSNNISTPTLKIGSAAAITITNPDGSGIVTNTIRANFPILLELNPSGGLWLLMASPAGASGSGGSGVGTWHRAATINTSGTFTLNTAVQKTRLTMVGGGAGGNGNAGGPAGGGARIVVLDDTPFAQGATLNITIGAGSAGGNYNSSDGGTTEVTDGTTSFFAEGGKASGDGGGAGVGVAGLGIPVTSTTILPAGLSNSSDAGGANGVDQGGFGTTGGAGGGEGGNRPGGGTNSIFGTFPGGAATSGSGDGGGGGASLGAGGHGGTASGASPQAGQGPGAGGGGGATGQVGAAGINGVVYIDELY